LPSYANHLICWRKRSSRACATTGETPKTKAETWLAKTDRLDAQIIARFAEAVRPEPRLVPSAEAQALGELVARRRQIVEMIGAESSRRRHLTHKRVLRGLERIVAELQTQLSEIEREIDDNVRGTPAWRARGKTCSPACPRSATPSPAP
jgi:transposase